MDLIDIYMPEIETYVRYKRVPYDDVDVFVAENTTTKGDELIKRILELCVFNLRSEISDTLRLLERKEATDALRKIYNGCIMLNPGLDVDEWLSLTNEFSVAKSDTTDLATISEKERTPKPNTKTSNRKRKVLTKAKFLGLEDHLRSNIIGQDEAIEVVVSALKRVVAGISDTERPLAVLLFAGSSGVGKTQIAKELQSYIYGDAPIVRVDCGELQHKHENQKLIGAPPSYVGYDDGGHLTNRLKENPRTVVLLDEVEKAHPDIWNTFLRVFDEGAITDGSGTEVSFKDAIIIMTTNLGNKDITSSVYGADIGFNKDMSASNPSKDATNNYVDKAIKKHFRTEFINRIDKVVVFNHLTKDNLREISELELDKLQEKLSKRGLTLVYGDSVIEKMVEYGTNPIEGARGLVSVRRDMIEDAISNELLESSIPRGSMVDISWDDDIQVSVRRSSKKRE